MQQINLNNTYQYITLINGIKYHKIENWRNKMKTRLDAGLVKNTPFNK